MTDYAQTYCTKCHEKTEWRGAPQMSLTVNQKALLRGKCTQCLSSKCTFVSAAFARDHRASADRTSRKPSKNKRSAAAKTTAKKKSKSK